MNKPERQNSGIVAAGLTGTADEQGLPKPAAWEKAAPLAFCADWRGEHPDRQRKTEVRMLWSHDCLYLRFRCAYREIFVYEGGDSRRDRLWMRDVAEIFIQNPGDELRHYREFEISPNGDWLDLDISPGQKTILMCDMKSRVVRDADRWTAELALPMKVLAPKFDPEEVWRLNLFRIEGRAPNRFYSAWRPTWTPEPNFHVPERFGELRFAP